MKQRKISYSELEAATGISKSSLQRYFSGKTPKIPAERLIKLADYFEVTTDYLVGTSNDPHAIAADQQQHDDGLKVSAFFEDLGYTVIYEDSDPHEVGKAQDGTPIFHDPEMDLLIEEQSSGKLFIVPNTAWAELKSKVQRYARFEITDLLEKCEQITDADISDFLDSCEPFEDDEK